MGEEFNNSVRHKLLAYLASGNIQALSPMLSPLWSRSDKGPYAPCSNWSERHAAYAAGLGTFGLCDGLITPVGKAVRVGSVIAGIALPVTERPYTDHHAYCLHYSHGSCGVCIERCPVQALSEQGHDKKRCMQYTEYTMNSYIKKEFNLDTYACGLCQAAVPCMNGIPQPVDD
jgi:epoxyqueuosine reductase QueG